MWIYSLGSKEISPSFTSSYPLDRRWCCCTWFHKTIPTDPTRFHDTTQLQNDPRSAENKTFSWSLVIFDRRSSALWDHVHQLPLDEIHNGARAQHGSCQANGERHEAEIPYTSTKVSHSSSLSESSTLKWQLYRPRVNSNTFLWSTEHFQTLKQLGIVYTRLHVVAPYVVHFNKEYRLNLRFSSQPYLWLMTISKGSRSSCSDWTRVSKNIL